MRRQSHKLLKQCLLLLPNKSNC
nr:protein E6A [Equid gammaherpesvirus 5]